MRMKLAGLGVLVLCCALPAHAVREGSHTAVAFAERYERDGKHRLAALWREAAVEMLERISLPMSQEIRRYQLRMEDADGLAGWDRFYRLEVLDALAMNRAALQRDRQLGAREPAHLEQLAREKARVEDVTLNWIIAYPDRFFRYGFYQQIQDFQEGMLASGNAAAAVEHEALAREICARQYRSVAVRYLADRADRFQRAGEAARARRFRRLARHYARLAAQQDEEAAAIRAHRQLIAGFLSHPAALGANVDHPLLRRLASARLAGITRPGSLEANLARPDPDVRLQVARQLVRTRQADGLLAGAENDDPAVRNLCSASLVAELQRGDLAIVHGLVDALGTGNHDQVAAAHRLLLAYSGTRSPVPEEFLAERDDQARAFWRSWWRSTLRPGLRAEYFLDEGCHEPLPAGPGAVAAPAALIVPPGAASARLETVIGVREKGVYLLSVREEGAARAWLDGSCLALTDDAAHTRARSARLLLAPGDHVLRLEYAPAKGGPSGPEMAIVPVSGGERGEPVSFLYHVRYHVRPPTGGDPAKQAAAPLVWLVGALLVIPAALLALRLRRRSSH
jgi:hypothetical protein